MKSKVLIPIVLIVLVLAIVLLFLFVSDRSSLNQDVDRLNSEINQSLEDLEDFVSLDYDDFDYGEDSEGSLDLDKEIDDLIKDLDSELRAIDSLEYEEIGDMEY